MELSLKFDNNNNPFEFYYQSNPRNVLEPNYLIITLDFLDMAFKKNRTFLNYWRTLKDKTLLVDKITKSRYIITSHTVKTERLRYVFSFSLVPEAEFYAPSNSTNTFNDCTFIDKSIKFNSFECYYSQMSYNDVQLLKELVELITNEKSLEKSKLEKFKDMLINNTDVLGIIVPIILKIIGM